MATRTRSTLVAIGLLVATFSYAGGAAQTPVGRGGQTPANTDAAVLDEFQRRLKEYIALHEKSEATLPNLPNNAEAAHIDRHQRALEGLIIAARANAKPGDVFGPGMAAVVKRLLKPAFTGTAGQQNRAVIADPDEKYPTVPMRVNARWPDGIPLSTMPPDVLKALPDLVASKEHEVKFYFIGRNLVLLDVHAHLIVDYILDVMPL